jgi:DNA-binding response OmpR family regulator
VLAAQEFDLLIVDLGLPRLHGLEVLWRRRERGSSLPVLIFMAADSVEQRVQGLDLGADDCMAKPFSLQELEVRVRAVLQLEGSGPGVAAAAREKVFRPFYRSLGSDADGSGLGLAIVRTPRPRPKRAAARRDRASPRPRAC